jgi:hypothetical protein
MPGIEPIPIPGVIVPGMVEGRGIPGIVEKRISVPIPPTVIIPGVVIPRGVRPGPVVPRISPTPIIIVPHIPRPEGPGVVPSPGGGVPNRYSIVFKRETDILAVRNHQGVSGAEDIGLGGMGVGQQIIQFFMGGSRLLGYNRRTGVDTVVKSLALKTACGRA